MRHLFLVLTVFGCLGLAYGSSANSVREPATASRVAGTPIAVSEPVITVEAGIDGEIFPVFANYDSMRPAETRKWGIVAVAIENPTDTALRGRVAVRLPGWSDLEIQIAHVPARESRTYLFAPACLPRFYANREITAATAEVTVSELSGKVLYMQTFAVRIRSVEDMLWGTGFQYAPFISSWVTPHDPEIEDILSNAKEFMVGRRLPGYDPGKSAMEQEQSTYAQARAIYRALQARGMSYVKSSVTFGNHLDVSERVRMPRQALRSVSANCIDGTVVFASLFENLGMDPVIVLVPGHAYVGVRVAPGSSKYLYIETAITGRASFEESVEMAEKGMASFKGREIATIRVRDARAAGIYPMPVSLDVPDAPEQLRMGKANSHP